MAQDQTAAPARTPWTKIFTAFKIALDIKKLLLAAAGIFLAAVGAWGLSGTFYFFRTFPEWKNYEDKEKPAAAEAQWNYFKAKRASWNLIYELAGSPSERKRVDAADVADTLEEYGYLQKWEEAYQRFSKPLVLKVSEKDAVLEGFENKDLKFTLTTDDKDALAELQKVRITVGSLRDLKEEKVKVRDAESTVRSLRIEGIKVTVDGPFDKLKEYRDGKPATAESPAVLGAMTLAQIEKSADNDAARDALKKFKAQLVEPRVKAAGLLCIWPWHEYRGENQYLIVARTLKAHDAIGTGGDILHWLFSARALVLLEPLVKFLTPFVYLFDERAGGWDRLYLILVIIWMLTIWGFFGGAICRIAAVQVARNERISLAEAISFTRERFVSYIAAPIFPMVLLGIFVLILILFGWLVWIPWFGEFFGGVLWVFVLLIGFMMAVVMVGMVGWPLMVATISTEGTDSFDALSRSYSYVYQAPWQFVWYNFLAVVYGAVLIFFVGFMASLLVFVGKWGVSSAPGLAKADEKRDREPSYLFIYAPTSYGWRDLLISSNTQHVVSNKVDAPDGHKIVKYEFTPKYEQAISVPNRIGAFLVAVWIYPFFLLVLGFGYSYFWTASTIVYFLMRHQVDDTEMDEVHMEDEDLEDPFLSATTPPPSAAPPPGKPGTVSLNVVDAPPGPPPSTSYTADEQPPTRPAIDETLTSPSPSPPDSPSGNSTPPNDGQQHN